MTDPGYLLRFKEAARLLGITEAALLDGVRSGQIPVRIITLGARGDRYVIRDDLDRFITDEGMTHAKQPV